MEDECKVEIFSLGLLKCVNFFLNNRTLFM